MRCYILVIVVASLLMGNGGASAEMVSDGWQKEIPSEAMVLKETGRTFILEKEYSKAIDVLEKSVAIKPDYYLAIYNLGLAYAMRGFYVHNPSQKDEQRGHELFQQALKIATENNFQDAYIYYIVGWSTLRRLIFLYDPDTDVARRYSEIDQMAQKALQIDPNLGKAHYLLGTVSELKGDLEHALIHYSRAKDLGEKMAEEDIVRVRTRIDKK